MPVGSVSILIVGQGTRDFTLISEVLGSLVSFHVVEKTAYVFRSNWVWVVRSTEGRRANVRDSN
jgi:hypothetical protein